MLIAAMLKTIGVILGISLGGFLVVIIFIIGVNIRRGWLLARQKEEEGK